MGFLRQCKSSVRYSSVSKNLVGFQSGLATPNRLMSSKTLLGFHSTKSLPNVKVSDGPNTMLGLGYGQILHNPLNHYSVGRTQNSKKMLGFESCCMLSFGTRYYSVERNQDGNFKTMPLIKYLSYFTVFLGKFVNVPFFGKFVNVAFTKQTLLVFPFFDKLYRDLSVYNLKEEVLPDTHPHCIRVREIARKIIKELEKESGRHHTLAEKQLCRGDDDEVTEIEVPFESITRIVQLERKIVKVVQETRNNGNLEGINWEIFVLDCPCVHAQYLETGKILVPRGFCDFYEEDAEIAFMIGHQIGHVVARHSLREKAWIRFNIFPFMLYYILMYGISVTSYFASRHEQEADYIGMLLSASAGYNPRVAPMTLKKMQAISEQHGAHFDDLEKRIEFLSQPKVMQEAVSIYQESIKGQGTD